MKRLTTQDMKILIVLKEFPQGATLTQITRFAEIKKKQYALYYLNKLITKGHADKRNKLYYLRGRLPLVQGTKPITTKTQRPHAIQANARLFRSSWGSLETTLSRMKIPYAKELKGNILRFSWQGRELRASSQWLYTFEQVEEAPFNLPIAKLLEEATTATAALIEGFLAKSGLRCLRDVYGALLVSARYWENGYPENEIAEKSLEDKNRIVYAVDSRGRPRAWADSSIDPFKELETNSETVDTEMKQYIQAIENKEIQPYKDEIDKRIRLKLIEERENSMITIIEKFQGSLEAMTGQIGGLAQDAIRKNYDIADLKAGRLQQRGRRGAG